MSVTPLAVLDVGVCTPIGINTSMVQAEVFAGSSSFVMSDEQVRTSKADLIEFDSRTHRMIALTAQALRPVVHTAVAYNISQLPLILAVPDEESGGPFDLEQIADGVRRSFPGSISAFIEWVESGRTGFFQALHKAQVTIQNRKSEYVLVGAVDSLCDGESLRYLSFIGRTGEESGDGIVPGEAAGFALLASAQRQPQAQAFIIDVETGLEKNHFGKPEPNLAEGLTDVFTRLRQHPNIQGLRLHRVLSCQTGETYWDRELSAAYLRAADWFPDTLDVELVAESHGDVGTAAGVVQLAMSLGAPEDQPQQPESLGLIYGCADEGQIGACLVIGSSPENELDARLEWHQPHLGMRPYLYDKYTGHLDTIGFLLEARLIRLRESLVPWTSIQRVDLQISRYRAALLAGADAAKEIATELLKEEGELLSGAVFFLVDGIGTEDLHNELLEHFLEAEDLNSWWLGLANTRSSASFPGQLEIILDSHDIKEAHLTFIVNLLSYRRQLDPKKLSYLLSQAPLGSEMENSLCRALACVGADGETHNISKRYRQDPKSAAKLLALLCLGHFADLALARHHLQTNPEADMALARVLAVGGEQQDCELISQLLNQYGPSRELLYALGTLGFVEAVPTLFEVSELDPEYALVALEMLELICGAGVTDLNLNSWPTFDEEQQEICMQQITTDSKHWKEWWVNNTNRFNPGQRYRYGLPLSREVQKRGLTDDNSPYSIRQASAWEMSFLNHGSFSLELEWPVKRQIEAIRTI